MSLRFITVTRVERVHFDTTPPNLEVGGPDRIIVDQITHIRPIYDGQITEISLVGKDHIWVTESVDEVQRMITRASRS